MARQKTMQLAVKETSWIIGFLCLLHVINGSGGTVPPTVPPTRIPASQPCLDGWHYSSKLEMCFYLSVVAEHRSWQGARDYCKERGADLTVIDNVHTHIFLQGIMNQVIGSFWFGLNDIQVEGEFHNLDQTAPADYFWWRVGAPHNNNNADCALIYQIETRYWSVSACRNQQQFTCQMDAEYFVPNVTTAPTPSKFCAVGWQLLEEVGSCFYVPDEEASFDVATRRCAEEGGRLAIIQETETNIFVTDLLKSRNGSFWFDLRLGTVEEGFQWISNDSAANYFWWGLDQPDNEVEGACVAIDSAYDLKWNDELCFNQKQFICQATAFTPNTSNTPIPLTDNQPCPDEWFHDKDGGTCYAAVKRRVSWENAREYCQTLGGDLITVKDMNSEVVINYILYHNIDDYWIGLIYNIQHQSYHWLDETENVDPNGPWLSHLGRILENFDHNNATTHTCLFITPHMIGVLTECSSEYPFMCQRPQSANFNETHEAFNETCDSGWLLHEDERKCYLLSDESLDWHSARSRCQDYGGDLPVFPDPGSLIFFNDLVNQHVNPYWIGIYTQGNDRGFQSLDDPAVPQLSYWESGQPNDYNNEACVFVNPENNLRWNDVPCSENRVMACQKPASSSTTVPKTNTRETTPSTAPLPSRCPHEWHHQAITDTCIFLSQTRTDWYTARAFCQVAQADLAVIKNPETENSLSGIMASQPGPYWIGLHDDHNEGDFYWLDEAVQATYTNWSPGEPNNVNDEDCAFVTPNTFTWNDAGCLAELLYACEKPGADEVTNSTAVSINGKCPTDFVYYEEVDVCYRFFEREMSWRGARAFCGHYGGDLATIKNEEIEAHVSSLLEEKRSDYWVGLHDAGLEGVFHWLDDIQQATYFAWALNQPDNEDNNEDCVIIKYTSGSAKWSDEPCHHNHFFLCETGAYIDGVVPSTQATVPTPNPSEPCLPGWTFHPNAQTCYSSSTVAASWNEARGYCMSLGSDLAVIKNTDAQIVINHLLTKNRRNTWIGLHDQEYEGRFIWLDETDPVEFTFWKPNEPNNAGNEDCTFITNNMGWQDGTCASEMLFVCERAAVQIPTVSTPISGSCPDSWYYDPQGQICYGLFDNDLSWTAARNECQKYQDGDLAVFTDPQRLIFVNDLISRGELNPYWIGLHKNSTGGYKWLGDVTEIYPYWWDILENNIYGPGELCVYTNYYSPFRWSEDPCLNTYGYICQASPTITATTPTPTHPIPTGPSSGISQDSNTSTTPGVGATEEVNNSGSDTLSSGAVIGIVIAVLVVVAVVGVAVYFFNKRSKRRFSFNTLHSPSEGFNNVVYDNTSTVSMT